MHVCICYCSIDLKLAKELSLALKTSHTISFCEIRTPDHQTSRIDDDNLHISISTVRPPLAALLLVGDIDADTTIVIGPRFSNNGNVQLYYNTDINNVMVSVMVDNCLSIPKQATVPEELEFLISDYIKENKTIDFNEFVRATFFLP